MNMNADKLSELYAEIEERANAKLNRVISILKPKAEEDPEIQEAINVLEQWRDLR